MDLAGSERTAFTGATGHVLNQSIAINKSLFTLRKVIATLAAAATKGIELARMRLGLWLIVRCIYIQCFAF